MDYLNNLCTAFEAVVTSPFIFFALVLIAAGMTVAHFADDKNKH